MTMNKTSLMVFLALIFGPCLSLLQAHHGWAEFDSGKEITLVGIVADFHFVNPHCVVEFDVKDDKGQAQRWQAEFASPVQLARSGWNAGKLQPGDRISITGHAAKNGAHAVHALRIRLADGQEFNLDRGQ